MPSPIEIIVPLVETAITIMPELLEIPILGRILISLAPNGGNDTKALEQLEKIAQQKKTDRETRRQRNERYVLKASDALDCCEKQIFSPAILFAMVKGLANAITGKPDTSADILYDQIATCIEEHVLRQDTPRSQPRAQRRGKYGRPAKGHGKGRGKF
jgi:hypothetical protein